MHQNVGINVGINSTEEKLLQLLLQNPRMSQNELAIQIGKTKKTVERNLKKLVEKGYIIRQGSRKNGQWRVER